LPQTQLQYRSSVILHSILRFRLTPKASGQRLLLCFGALRNSSSRAAERRSMLQGSAVLKSIVYARSKNNEWQAGYGLRCMCQHIAAFDWKRGFELSTPAGSTRHGRAAFRSAMVEPQQSGAYEPSGKCSIDLHKRRYHNGGEL
jgi:hypothetical protein